MLFTVVFFPAVFSLLCSRQYELSCRGWLLLKIRDHCLLVLYRRSRSASFQPDVYCHREDVQWLRFHRVCCLLLVVYSYHGVNVCISRVPMHISSGHRYQHNCF